MRIIYIVLVLLTCMFSASAAVARPSYPAEMAKECDTTNSLDSINACREFIRVRNPKGRLLSQVHNNIGIAHSRMGDHEHAVEAYSNALKADSRYVLPRLNRARALAALAKFDDAIVDMDGVVKLAPTADNFALRADIKVRHSDLDGALGDYAEAIKRQPTVAVHYENRAMVHGKLSQHEDAIEDYSRAIQLNLRNPSLYFGRGLAWADAGRCDLAVPDYTKAIELSPRFSSAYNNRGVCYSRAGKRDEAIADYEAALKFEPGNEKARGNLSAVRNAPVARPVPPIIEVPKFEVPPVREMLKVPEYSIEAVPTVVAPPEMKKQ